MVNIELIGHDYNYSVEEIINLFIESKDVKDYKIISILSKDKSLSVKAQIIIDNKSISEYELDEEYNENISELELKKHAKRLIKMSLFMAFKKIIQKNIPWGILTGIRPTKIVHEMMDKQLLNNEIISILTSQYEIEEEKAKLLISVAKKEKEILDNSKPNSIGIYIGIPFCPTRCSYCTFSSSTIKQFGNLRDDYISALTKEMNCVKNIIEKNNWSIETIYIGGGTPTSLTEEQMDRFLKEANKKFNFKNVKEITFEAGRPDTINRKKLEIIKNYDIDRISINPQTMNDETLKIIQRNHTSQDIIDRYYLAREVGFNNINMDIIVGLPSENALHVENTMKKLSKLNPESLTVHTLALKRASIINKNIEDYELTQADTVREMLDITQTYSERMNMNPYYMYRQKNMLGNFENVGYCKNGYESIYNVQIMEEKQSIIALGSGGVSKIVDLGTNRIERIFNVKNPDEYIRRIDEMIERKSILT